MTWAGSKHILFTFLSLATASTISLVIPTTPSNVLPKSPHSFNANAASSMRRFVADAISARVDCTTTCEVALPSGLEIVSTVRIAAIVSRFTYRYVEYWTESHIDTSRHPPSSPFGDENVEFESGVSPSHPFARFFRELASSKGGGNTPVRSGSRPEDVIVGRSGGRTDKSRLHKNDEDSA